MAPVFPMMKREELDLRPGLDGDLPVVKTSISAAYQASYHPVAPVNPSAFGTRFVDPSFITMQLNYAQLGGMFSAGKQAARTSSGKPNAATVHASEAFVLHRGIKLGEEITLKPAAAPDVAPHRLGVITTTTTHLIASAGSTTPELVGAVTRTGITVDPILAAANAAANSLPHTTRTSALSSSSSTTSSTTNPTTTSTPTTPTSSSSKDFRTDRGGSTYVGTTTFTPELVVGYCNDFTGKNPIHHDPEVAHAAGYRAPIAAGAQGLHVCFSHLCTLVGGELPNALNVACTFKRAIFWDDTVELWFRPLLDGAGGASAGAGASASAGSSAGAPGVGTYALLKPADGYKVAIEMVVHSAEPVNPPPPASTTTATPPGVEGCGAGLFSLSQPDRACLAGAWRRPYNDLQHQKVGGGHKAIHDDATAAEIGFGAAPIHGTVHWSQWTPLLLQAFGAAWFESGSISVHFKTPVGHLEPVRAFCALPASGACSPTAAGTQAAPQQLEVWMEHMDGRVVLQGTASVGIAPTDAAAPRTMAASRMAGIKPVEGGLLFVRAPVGTKSTNVETARIDFDKEIGPLFPFTLNQKLEIITEYHPWFSAEGGNSSPWGRAILPPESLNSIMLGFCGASLGSTWPARPEDDWYHEAADGDTPVGLFGGCEVIMHNGPVFVGQDYEVTRELVAKGETPKTEFRWEKTTLKEPGVGGKIVAEMTLQDMKLKNTFRDYKALRRVSDAKAAAAAAAAAVKAKL